MRNTKFYSQATHSVIVSANDGSFRRTLRDFAEGDDVIGVEPQGDRVALSQGFDRSALSFSSADGGAVTLKLKPTSPDVGLLNSLFNRQKTTPILLDVTVTSGVDDVVVLQEAGIMVEQFNSGGPTMQPRSFRFLGAILNLDENEGA